MYLDVHKFKEENMRKVLALLLALVLAIGSFAACEGVTPAPAQNEGDKTDEGAKTDEGGEDAAEIPTVKLSYAWIVFGPSPEAVDLVEETVNEYLDKINYGIHVDLDCVDGSNYATQIDMALLSGEPIDVYTILGDLSAEVSNNKLLPLNDYLDNELKPTTDLMGRDSFGGCTFNGNVYSIPRYCTDVLTYYWVCDYERQKGILDLEEGDEYTIDELDAALALLKEAYPDMITIATFPASYEHSLNSFQTAAVFGGVQYDSVTSLGSGVAIVGDELNAVNYYETETFAKDVALSHDWYTKGYTNEDASVVSDNAYDLVKADRALSYIIGYGGKDARITDGEDDNTHGKSVIYVPLANNLRTAQTLSYGVAQGCKNPAAAAKCINLLFTDAFFLNTLLYGVEGRDYEDTGLGASEYDRVVKYPEGETSQSVPYNCFLSCGFLGNEYLDWPQLKADGTFEDKRAERQEFEAAAKLSPAFGFTFDTANVTGEAGAISNVVQQYVGGLLTGELDPDEYVPQLQQDLKDAGIDKVVAEAQAQLDAWAANK